MAKVFMRNSNENAIQISDWTLFSLGTFVGSAYYIRPENYETQLLKADWDIDWNTCFPGKFIKLCNDFTGPKRYGTAFYLCFSDEFDETKCLWCSTWNQTAPYNINYGTNMFFPATLAPNPNPNHYNTTIYFTSVYQTHAPTDQNYCFVFSDIPFYNTIFLTFNEIVNYNSTISPSKAYCVYKDPNDNDFYYGFNTPLRRDSLEINPPNSIKNFSFFMDKLIDQSPVQVDTDPYVDGGGSSSGGQGGGGAWDDSTEVVQPSTLNLPNTTDILKIYSMDQTTLASLASVLCSHSYSNWQSYLPMYTNPLDGIITLHWMPVNTSSTVIGSITIGNFSTSVATDVITNQYVEYSLGSLTVPEYWGNYLDYDATRLQLFLPYIGSVNLNPDEVMRKDLRIKYNIDLLTGTCVAIVYTYNDTIIFTGSGNMAIELPLSSVTFANTTSAFLSASSGLASSALMMSMAASPGALPAVMASSAVSTAVSIMSAKPNYSKSGYVGSCAGAMSTQYAYLLISRPAQCVPQNNNEFSGYPLYSTVQLSTCSGFTKVDQINLSNCTATDNEKNMIVNILKEGVLI